MLLRRCLLLILFFALPIQGALAASRLCMAMMSTQPAATIADDAHEHHAGHAAGMQHDTGMHDAAGTPEADTSAPHDHATDTCKLCSACCLTAAGAPLAPVVALLDTTYAGHGPLAVPVPHNVADGLERPPRTI